MLKSGSGNLLLRVALFLGGGILVLQASSHLRAGEPDFESWFEQPVSSPVALLVGACTCLGALVPWPRSRLRERRSARGGSHSRRKGELSAGRNDPCRCGSGRKYKRCCLPRDELDGREARLRGRTPETGRRAVEDVIDVAHRGLRG